MNFGIELILNGKCASIELNCIELNESKDWIESI